MVLAKTLGEERPFQALEYGQYATQFDKMCELIPVYQENIDFLIDLLPKLSLPENANICDLGAGTGNFVCAMAEVMPSASFIHVDSDPVMNAYAREKYSRKGIQNVEVIEDYIQRARFRDREFDLIVCVNALNTAAPQLPVLRQIGRWLKTSGTLFLIDFGRKQRVLDWGWYILRNTLKRYGVSRYMRALIENREAIRQNRRASKDQANGSMWTHSMEEFQALVVEAGFRIEDSKTCYRGYCDLVVATRRRDACES